MRNLKALGDSDSSSEKEEILGQPKRQNRTALYLRVSTPDQKLDLQYDGLHSYADRAGLLVVADYSDIAVSGRREGRPQLNALMKSVRNHEIDCVLARLMQQRRTEPRPSGTGFLFRDII